MVNLGTRKEARQFFGFTCGSSGPVLVAISNDGMELALFWLYEISHSFCLTTDIQTSSRVSPKRCLDFIYKRHYLTGETEEMRKMNLKTIIS